MRLAIARSMLVVLGVAAATASMELVQRVRTGHGRAEALEALALIESSALDSVPRQVREAARGGAGDNPRYPRVVHPYLGYGPKQTPELLADAQRRVRSAPDDACVVLVLGGSVAFNFHRDGLETLASLEPLKGRSVVPVLGAAGGYKQPQQVMQLAYLLSMGLVPDLVINLDGFNEVALSAVNLEAGFHPVQPSITHWLPLARAGSGDTLSGLGRLTYLRDQLVTQLREARESPLLSSALVAPRLIGRVRSTSAAYRGQSQALAEQLGNDESVAYLSGLPPKNAHDMGSAVSTWVEGSRSLAALCAGRGIAYVHVLQPTLHDPGAKPMSERERAECTIGPLWLFGVERGYPLLRRAGDTLTREGIAYLDASRVFAEVSDTLYYDNCHFDPRGNELLAEAIADFLRDCVERGQLEL